MLLNTCTTVTQISSCLHEGILEPAQWKAGLQDIQAKLDCAAFHHLDISSENKNTRSIAASLQGIEPPSDKLLEYERHYAPQDIRVSAMWGKQEGEVWWDHEHFCAKTLHRAPVYSEFLASIGLRHTVCIPLRDGIVSRDFVGFIRHLDQEPFAVDAQNLVAQLIPHMLRANKLRYHTTRLAEQAALGFAALDALPQALAVVDAGLRLRYLNAAAEHTLANPRGLTLQHGVLHASDLSTQCHLAQCATMACGLIGPARAGEVSISLANEKVPGTTLIHVFPLQANHPLAHALHNIPHALLVWAAPLSSQRTSHICMVLGLTETEARLALMLAQGLTVKDFALTQGCSWHTARTHARNLLRKTGCQRQADVARLVQSLMWV